MPDVLRPRLEVGSQVRVPLGGRRVRGYVVELGERDDPRLKDVLAVSGALPVFHGPLLDGLRWAAAHYVAPVAALLERAAPPNLPTRAPEARGDGGLGDRAAGLPEVARGGRVGTRYLLTRSGDLGWVASVLDPVVAAGRSALVVVPTGPEAHAVAVAAEAAIPGRVIEVAPQADARATTEAWSRAATEPGLVVVGTPRCSYWPVTALDLAVMVEEGRRAMKERQTPTVHARDLLRTRSRRERFALLLVGPMPSTEALAGGVEVARRSQGGRLWAFVEVVDRSEEPPGAGVLSEHAKQAVRATRSRGGRIFVFTHRRGYAPATRCVRCRTVRRCPSCGARPDRSPTCGRCGAELGPCARCGGARFEALGAGVGRVAEELRRFLGAESVAEAPGPAAVQVGTERDLAALEPVDLAVAADADGLILGSNYRAGEEALRLLVRVAGKVRPAGGCRLLVQTSMPDHPVIVALRRADPLPFVRGELADRSAFGYPPASDLMVIEVRDAGDPSSYDEDLRGAAEPEATVLGPAEAPAGRRWLVQGRDLTRARTRLRPVVQRWRDGGATVRIDVDPIDL